jgi:hypothetical protein
MQLAGYIILMRKQREWTREELNIYYLISIIVDYK